MARSERFRLPLYLLLVIAMLLFLKFGAFVKFIGSSAKPASPSASSTQVRDATKSERETRRNETASKPSNSTPVILSTLPSKDSRSGSTKVRRKSRKNDTVENVDARGSHTRSFNRSSQIKSPTFAIIKKKHESRSSKKTMKSRIESVKSNMHNPIEPKYMNIDRKNLVNYFSPRKFYPNASFGFVQYSAYRFSPNQIAIIGLGPSSIRRFHKIGPCIWFGNNGDTIFGKFNYTFNGEMQKTDDEEVFVCNLNKPTGDAGGYLVGDLNNELRIMFEEKSGKLQSANEPFRINNTFCGAPFHGKINGRAVFEWMEYHRVILGIDNFIFYCINALDQKFYDLVRPYLDAKILKLVDFKDLLKFDVWYYGQVMANLDCMYQIALESRWIFLHDFDEYLHPVPPNTLPSLLEKHKDKAWMTHGMIEFTINYCNNRTGDHLFAIQKMVFREPRVYCVEKLLANRNLCLSWPGHRKLIVNPRKAFFAQVHRVPFPKENGIDFDASSELRHYHFRRIITLPTSGYCNTIFHANPRRWWIRDESLASTVPKIRSHPLTISSRNSM